MGSVRLKVTTLSAGMEMYVAGKCGARSAGAGSQQAADQGTLAAAGDATN